jgi:hypothetical protein
VNPSKSQNITVTFLRSPSLALDLVALGEDLFGQALGQVALDFGEFVVGGEIFW